jgi:hypothetical protein
MLLSDALITSPTISENTREYNARRTVQSMFDRCDTGDSTISQPRGIMKRAGDTAPVLGHPLRKQVSLLVPGESGAKTEGMYPTAYYPNEERMSVNAVVNVGGIVATDSTKSSDEQESEKEENPYKKCLVKAYTVEHGHMETRPEDQERLKQDLLAPIRVTPAENKFEYKDMKKKSKAERNQPDEERRQRLLFLCKQAYVEERTIEWFCQDQYWQHWVAMVRKVKELLRRRDREPANGVKNPTAWLTTYFNHLLKEEAKNPTGSPSPSTASTMSASPRPMTTRPELFGRANTSPMAPLSPMQERASCLRG